MRFLGQKRHSLYEEFISKYIPNNIDIYIEPFAGSFSIAYYLIEDNISINKFIYNDINNYSFTINADKIHHLDYKDIFRLYDSENVFFYLDPPYFKKEFLYDGCEDYSKEFHIELKNEIQKLKGNFLLSYENNKFIRELYNDFNIISYTGDNYIFKNELLIKKL